MKKVTEEDSVEFTVLKGFWFKYHDVIMKKLSYFMTDQKWAKPHRFTLGKCLTECSFEQWAKGVK